jgi:hypothetical protein
MSPTAITMQLELLSQIRKLVLLLRQIGKKVGLHYQSINSTTYNNSPYNLPQR